MIRSFCRASVKCLSRKWRKNSRQPGLWSPYQRQVLLNSRDFAPKGCHISSVVCRDSSIRGYFYFYYSISLRRGRPIASFLQGLLKFTVSSLVRTFMHTLQTAIRAILYIRCICILHLHIAHISRSSLACLLGCLCTLHTVHIIMYVQFRD